MVQWFAIICRGCSCLKGTLHSPHQQQIYCEELLKLSLLKNCCAFQFYLYRFRTEFLVTIAKCSSSEVFPEIQRVFTILKHNKLYVSFRTNDVESRPLRECEKYRGQGASERKKSQSRTSFRSPDRPSIECVFSIFSC